MNEASVKWIINKNTDNPALLQIYRDTCGKNNQTIDRVFCSHCFTKLASRIINNNLDNTSHPRDSDNDDNNDDDDDDADDGKQKRSRTDDKEVSSLSEDNNNNNNNNLLWVNMGPLDDSTIPKKLAQQWQRQRGITTMIQ